MNLRLWICGALLVALPLLAQDPEPESDGMEQPPAMEGQRRRGPGVEFRRNPLERMRDVLAKAGVPLSEEQQQALRNLMEEQRRIFQQSRGERRTATGDRPQFSPEMRQRAEAFQQQLLALLTSEQQEAWKKYETEQVRQRGGYPALRLLLLEAGVPLSPEQEGQLQAAYREYNQQRRSLMEAGGGQADPAKVKELERENLLKVSQTLNTKQRRALIESRRQTQQPPPQ